MKNKVKTLTIPFVIYRYVSNFIDVFGEFIIINKDKPSHCMGNTFIKSSFKRFYESKINMKKRHLQFVAAQPNHRTSQAQLNFKKNTMKKYILSVIAISILFSCQESKEITITKIEGSPNYENSKLSLVDLTSNEELEFSFEVENYELGIQTPHDFKYGLANSGKGQHIHLIINNGPYSAHYSKNFKMKPDTGNNVILAFLSRSYHESVKNKNAFLFTQMGEGEKINLDQEFLFYSRPKGVYSGTDTEKLLLDFYLINTTISPSGNKVRATINETVFLIDDWAPYYIEGLPKGEVTIKLELINSSGALIENPFNPSTRTVTLK